MCAIQEISARVGRVTGRGIAGNLKQHYPRPFLVVLVSLLLVANTINLGADLGAMGAALKLVVGGPQLLYVAIFGVVSALLQVFSRYSRYVSVLKWLTLSLFAYVAVVMVAHVPWGQMARGLFLPAIQLKTDYLTVVVAVLGTTISPYLFFWQAAQEVEDVNSRPGHPRTRAEVRGHLRRIKWDTIVGMSFSNLIAFFIILSTAATLHRAGITDIQTSAQAAEALRPVAGDLTFVLFSLGIVGTGLLAVPVLAGSAAYAVAEAAGWQGSLSLRLDRGQGRGFYGVVAAATLGGVLLCFTPADPVKELFWSAVLNGVIAVPIMVVMMLLATRRATMGDHVIGPRLRWLGWTATAVMGAVVVAMLATW
jgi:Mn2+/Fe2+ NRAMP family transporter